MFKKRKIRKILGGPESADAFIEKWEALAAGERPTPDTFCLLCGTDIYPHSHSELQIAQRRGHIKAHIEAGIKLA